MLHINIRLPSHLAEQADRLIDYVKKTPAALIGGNVNRSSILRIAIQRGLESLEAEAKRKGRGRK